MVKKKVSKLDVYVVGSLMIMLTYTIVGIILQLLGFSLDSTLTTCFFSVFGGEIFSCAIIKWLKVKKES